MGNMRRGLLTACAILSVNFALYGYNEPRTKKLIHFGWSAPSTAEEIFKTDIKEFDANCPFDGIGIYPVITLKRGEKTVLYDPYRAAGNPQMLTKDDLKGLIPAFRHLQKTRLKHNFIRINCKFLIYIRFK